MKILAIGAHQDDNEILCGGVAHKYKKMGHEVRFLCLCNGSGGHHIMTPEETSARRAKEAAAVAAYLGIQYDSWSDVDDCSISATMELRERLIRYIRQFNPDVILTHRTNDYHADHRATALLVQDASYLLIVPHTCPDVPAMRQMPAILYYEDAFKYPPFEPDFILDVDDEIDAKLHIMHLNASQVYEWLPYTRLMEVPETNRFEWMKGMNVTSETTDEEIAAAPYGYAVRFAKTAARFRKELIERYGEERGSRIRFAEAFQVSEYGGKVDDKMRAELFSF